MANTTNLNLVKPAGTDKALVSVINSNSDKIDAFAGTTNQAISTLNSDINMKASTVGEFIACFSKNMVVRNVYIGNNVTIALTGQDRGAILTGYKTYDSKYIIFSITTSNGEPFTGWYTLSNGEVTLFENQLKKTTFITKTGVTLAAGETTNIDISSDHPSGYGIWSVQIQVMEGSTYYMLPWQNNNGGGMTFVASVSNTLIKIRNNHTNAWSNCTLYITAVWKKN